MYAVLQVLLHMTAIVRIGLVATLSLHKKLSPVSVIPAVAVMYLIVWLMKSLHLVGWLMECLHLIGSHMESPHLIGWHMESHHLIGWHMGSHHLIGWHMESHHLIGWHMGLYVKGDCCVALSSSSIDVSQVGDVH